MARWEEGAGCRCRRLGGASCRENALAAWSHGVTSIHGSGTGSRIHKLCGAWQPASLKTPLLVCLHINTLNVMHNYPSDL